MKNLVVVLVAFLSAESRAHCEIVNGSARTPFDGKTLTGLLIEKKSLVLLNSEYPNLNAVEATFKGELQTCTTAAFRRPLRSGA
jgi:hypothetical protein